MPRPKGKGAYMISAIAEMYEIHPQTLRLYEREGLLRPSRSDGNTRLYTDEDIERLEVILQLTRELGVNLAGVEIILNMREKMSAMQKQMEEFIAAMNLEIAQRVQSRPEDESGNMLIRVARSSQVVPAAKKK
jgi:MerR family transcriptional regulator, heat shock protein HspR